MKKTCLNIFFCLACSFLLAQTDSIVKKSDLVFKDEPERRAFFNAMDGNSQYLDLFLSTPENNKEVSFSTVSFKIDNCVNELREDIKGKSQEKQVKYIHAYVHRKFFTKYEFKNSFCDIFDKGFYNCVSSTALYAIIFTKLQIPFQIMEKPKHVFLIAYPESYKIFVETTSPDDGYMRFSETYVKNYVTYLYNVHIISQRDYETKETSALFEKYFYSSTPVSMTTLAGMQFANYSLYNMDDRNYPVAAREMKKACYLNDYERNRHILKYVLSLEVGNNNYNDQVYVKDLGILCRLNGINNTDITDQVIRDEFQRLTQHQLVERSDYEKYDESFRIISTSLKDTALNKDIRFIYHYSLARMGLIDAKKDSYVSKHLLDAYHINPEQADLRSMIISQVSRKIDQTSEADKILKLTNESTENFPFLGTLNWVNATKSNCILQLGYQSFLVGNALKGEAYLKEFESIMEADKSVEPTEIFIEKAYSEAATIYYKKGNVKRCREFLKRGLTYAPNSFGLQMRLSQS